ncbi:MAG: hypothetical protein ACI4R8_03060 [Candidatus Caccovivens sp.]
MKKFIIKANKYLDREVEGYYHCDYIGYQKHGNPDFINHLKNMSKQYSETDLVEDFVNVAEKLTADLKIIVGTQKHSKYTICTVPRSKTDKSYSQSQLMFKKAVSSVADSLGFKNGTNAIKRIKNTKTTHNWRLENNTGDEPYVGITKDTCEINKSAINNANIILVDDIYTEGVYVAEDCIQTLFDFGAKDVILYVIAKTRS